MKNITRFANKKGYEKVEYLGEYKGYKVYSAIYRDDGEIYFIGLPAFILEKDGKLQWIQDNRSFVILNYFYPNEE